MPDKRVPAVHPEQYASFGPLLRYLRQRAGLTQRELSIAVGYSDSQISRLEKNERGPDQSIVAARFVTALGLEHDPAWAGRLLALAALPSAEPALESAPPAVPNNLPAPITSFVGREAELAAVEQRLAASRLVTLTGSGGCGKTRLAIQTAGRMLAGYPDGVWLVELAPVTDSGLTPHVLAEALGVHEEAGVPLMAALTDFLKPKQALLVIDNCEHLVDACARLIETLLRACPRLRLLATSREALGLAGENAYRVPPMQVPSAQAPVGAADLERLDGVRLFIERAAAAEPRFALTGANAAAVAQICQRLDGMPLALELAAARAPMLSMEQIVARLDDRFHLLTRGSRTALPRQATLRAAIDWSHDMLSEPERVLFRRLAVFMGGWTLETAEVVCAGGGLEPAAVLDLLTRLVEKSLVHSETPAGPVRYGFLETIRQFAVEKLSAAGEDEQFRDRHLEYFIQRAEPIETTSFSWHKEGFLQLDTDRDNLRAALEWACGHRPGRARYLAGILRWYWILADRLNEASAWYKRVLSLDGGAARTRDVGVALLGWGCVCVMADFCEEGQAPLEQSLDILRADGDATRLSDNLWLLGYSLTGQGYNAQACRVFEADEALFRAATPTRLAAILSYWGRLLVFAGGDLARARSLEDEALTVAHSHRDLHSLGIVHMNLGYIAWITGDPAAARRHHIESLKWRREMGTQWLIAASLVNVAQTALLQEDYAEAQAFAQEALDIYQTLGRGIGGEADANLCLGAALIHLGAFTDAEQRLSASFFSFQERGFSLGPALVLASLAELRRCQGRPAQAVRWLACADRWLNRPLPSWYWPASVRYGRSLDAARGQLVEAEFASAWAAGQALTVDAALAEARAEAEAKA